MGICVIRVTRESGARKLACTRIETPERNKRLPGQGSRVARRKRQRLLKHRFRVRVLVCGEIQHAPASPDCGAVPHAHGSAKLSVSPLPVTKRKERFRSHEGLGRNAQQLDQTGIGTRCGVQTRDAGVECSRLLLRRGGHGSEQKQYRQTARAHHSDVSSGCSAKMSSKPTFPSSICCSTMASSSRSSCS